MVNVVVSSAGTSGPRGTGWMTGAGAPSNSIGFDGDLYLDTNNPSVYYGPKTAGVWGSSHPFTILPSNTTAIINPAPTNDTTQGYVVGSFWINTVTHVYYVASSVATNNAVWTPVLAVGTAAGTVAAGDDSRITGAIQSGSVAGGDLGGTLPNPTVVATHLASPLPLLQGGTGSTTKNFIDLTTNQTILGAKTFADRILVPSPISGGDAVNLSFVQGLAGGLIIHQEVAAATVAALPANTYNNGSSGVGATLTANAAGVLVIDSYTVLLNDRVFVKNEASAANNGIYTVTTLGTGSVPYVLTRATDMDQNAEIPGAAALVDNGTTNKGSGFTVFGAGPYTIGTTDINITQFSSPGFINVGLGLRQVGNTISLEIPVDPSNLPQATSTTYGVIELNTDLGGTATNPQVVATHLSSPLPLAQGGTAATTASGARTSLGLGTAATKNVDTNPVDIQALGTQAAGSTGQVADAGHVHPTTGVTLHSEAATTVVSETAYGQSTVVGTATTYAREDHSHGSPALPAVAPSTTEAIGTAAAAGTSGTPSRADHVHPMAAAGTPTTSAVGDSASTGNATTFAASNHVHGRESFGGVTALSSFNVAASNGVATTPSHSDHVHGVPALPVASSSVQGIVQLTGDLDGTSTSPSVVKVNGVSVTGTPVYGSSPVATSGTAAAWSILPTFASSGLYTGGVMTQNGSIANAFDITAASGYIVDYHTTPSAPVISTVSISAQTVTLSGSQTAQVVNYWYANSSGTILSQTTPLTGQQRRANILLGQTWSATGTGNLYNIMTAPIVLPYNTDTLWGVFLNLGGFSASGNIVSPNGANLNINKSAGTQLAMGYNYASGGVQTPNLVTNPAETAATFRYVTRNSSSQSATRTTLDVANYDNAGTITALAANGHAAVHRVWLIPTGTAGSQIVLQYGQVDYTTLAAANAAIGQETLVANPDVLGSQGVLIGYITATKTATTLNNTAQSVFFEVGKFPNP